MQLLYGCLYSISRLYAADSCHWERVHGNYAYNQMTISDQCIIEQQNSYVVVLHDS